MDLRKKKEYTLLEGLKKRQTSVTANSFIKDWITLAFDGAQALGEKRSSWGSSQQLKSPPNSKWCNDKSERWKKKAFEESVVVIVWSIDVSQNQLGVMNLAGHYDKSTIRVRDGTWMYKGSRFM